MIGSSNTDMVVKVPRIPQPGETILGGHFMMTAGGKGANQAVAAARAGGHVTLIARVGDDMFGQQALAGFKADGIDTRYVIQDRGAASGIATIMVDKKGSNCIAVASGANMRLTVDDVRRLENVIAEADVVLMQVEIPVETIVEAAVLSQKNSAMVILNPAPAMAIPDDLWQYIDVLTPNEIEAEQLSGTTVVDAETAWEAGKQLRDHGVGQVIVTLGEKGVAWVTRHETGKMEPMQVNPVDTTAAGDVFSGVLAVMLAEGETLNDSIRYASVAAAISVTRLGAQPSAPFRDEIEKLIGK